MPNLKQYSPLNLPDLDRQIDFDGIVHNHGVVKSDYSTSEGEGFILSSSEFGKAYLADGWATKFIRSILKKYVVLFVGYTADDPPVKYLLQGLNKLGDNPNLIYAFHQGTSGEANSSWSTKGVQAIPYDDPEGDHSYLWNTLEEWRQRAVNIDNWYEEIFSLADKGPENLSRHQRGQIAHIVSSITGAKKLAERDKPIPATWLCVFDSNIRYSTPGFDGFDIVNEGEWIDPFELYGLDEDAEPEKIDPNKSTVKERIKPHDAWDAFDLIERDKNNHAKISASQLRGAFSTNPAHLLERLHYLGIWIQKVSEQPAALWWASRQIGLHPDIQWAIRLKIDSVKSKVNPDIRKGWGFLFEAWANIKSDHDSSWYQLKTTIKNHGWSNALVRRFSDIIKPRYSIKKSWRNVIPPKNSDYHLHKLLNIKVQYPNHLVELDIEENFLPKVVKSLSSNLNLAIELDNDIGGYGPFNSDSIKEVAEKGIIDNSYHDMNILIDSLVIYLSKLIKLNPLSAKSEIESWTNHSSSIFTKIKTWAISQKSIYSTSEAEYFFLSLSNKEFWNHNNQDEILPSLANHWNEFRPPNLYHIQQLLLRGPAQYDNEKTDDYLSRKSYRILERITWLSNNGCRFTFDLEREKNKLINYCQEWSDKNAEDAANHSGISRSYSIKTETDYSKLLNIPISQVIDTAEKETGRKDDFRVEHEPFTGLITNKKIRAFSALIYKAKQGEYPEWAWRNFLSRDLRKDDKERLTISIARRLIQAPTDFLASIIHQISSWIETSISKFSKENKELFYKLFDRHIDIFNTNSLLAKSEIIDKSMEIDWVFKAINSPIGKLTLALLNDSVVKELKSNETFPDSWKLKLEKLLSLKDFNSCYALVILARNLNWLYDIDPKWTEECILSKIDKPLFGDAIWGGVLWNVRIPQNELFIKIKPHILKLIHTQKFNKRRETQSIAALFLGGWLTLYSENNRLISNIEMKEILLNADEELRSQIIWVYNRWLSSKDNETNQLIVDSAKEFFGDVWPKQIRAKSASISAKLFDFAISSMDKVENIVELVLPLMQSSKNSKIKSSHFINIDDDIIFNKYPDNCLELLYAILPDDAKTWPYGVGDILPKIVNTKPSLLRNDMYIELKRRWDAQ